MNAKFEDGEIWFQLNPPDGAWTYRTPEGAQRQVDYFRAEGRRLDFCDQIERAIEQYHAHHTREVA